MTQKIDLVRVLKYVLQMEETARGFLLENSKRFSHGAMAESLMNNSG
jgi:hypothetical protein